ncbi:MULTISPECIES: IclR family transcriptional regulator [Streptomyces violaceusniger group]|uniref:IclR family transcriptional regulator n=2 Tax=Streptomyces rhizosphaericus TaxID=114699 RepID=A0ABN1S1W6_9ACTN|nr:MULTISPECIES: IclR family transcriptional regulator [Streptomyces violaceusniger group]
MTTAAVPRGNGEEAGADGRSPKSVLGKVGLILSAFGDGDLSLSLTELTTRTGVAKATVHRLCQDLVASELLERDGSHYRLGLLLYAIGLRAPRQRTLRHAARPVMENLAQALDSPVSLSVPNGTDLLCIDNAGRHRNRAGAPIGGRLLQLHSTAPGKLTLALLPDQYPLARLAPHMRRMTARTLTADRLPGELARIQEQGYATDSEEHRLGYSAVAVPIRGPRDGAYLGALSVVAPTAHHNVPRTLTALRNAAEAVTTRLAVIEAYRTEP